MTTTAIRPGLVAVNAAAGRPAPRCPAERHGDTHYAYRRLGCRCPAAVAANKLCHRRHQMRKIARLRGQAPGQCGSWSHYATSREFRNGCRCPETVRVYVRVCKRKADRAIRDLLRPWRSIRKVDRTNLHLLMSGFRDSPTHAEHMVAAWLLTQAGMSAAQIAERIGSAPRRVTGYRSEIARLREQRGARRLAEAQARAVRNEFLAERRAAFGK
jgi:hypothetical protein